MDRRAARGRLKRAVYPASSPAWHDSRKQSENQAVGRHFRHF
jgi:hypothetical protein